VGETLGKFTRRRGRAFSDLPVASRHDEPDAPSLLLRGPWGGCRWQRRADGLDRIGLELYAVRKAMKENPEKTLAAIRAIGYTDVELLWSFKNFDRSPQQVKATLKAEGLTETSAHIAPETLLSERSESLRTSKLLGHQYLVVVSLPSETKRSINAWKIWADRFKVAGEEARRAGAGEEAVLRGTARGGR